MGSKMLIDAAHREETRVVVVRGNRIEDFDYESATRKQLRGNIYLAKVTRVEPSLQAAFVDYGGNRHGFLAFSEIHPDYYQIPVADRKALLEEDAAEESRALAEEKESDEAATSRGKRKPSRRRKKPAPDTKAEASEALEANNAGESVSELPAADAGADTEPDAQDGQSETPEDKEAQGAEEEATEAEADDTLEAKTDADADADADSDSSEDSENGESIESVGSEDALEELPERTRRKRKRYYKIQEVIKRRQIILVQVVKEERGNKGAALTTYLSLAGRYTVMMPNTARGGGISRKITTPSDRKRLRKIASDLDVADGMGLIIRTAGAARTKTEIKRDFEYLLRLWETIRDLTLNSTAPSLVYEEGNLIKRSIRDLYNKDIDSILVSGDAAYKEAKGFMRMLMPSHAKNVQPYKEPEPIFVRNKIERQLSAMFSPYVTLRSGGYIVLNQTEALVSIDVNSGKATREHSIEDTALKTNTEAAEEVARQLRLRDLAGLIVIDFIDMEERRNNRSVERKLKESLRHDRARIQVGRISHFGLMEMSRQRLRSGVVEGSTNTCTMCEGTGIVRSTESISLDVLRTLEDTLLSNGVSNLRAAVSVDAALYILNHKRSMLRDIESRYNVSILIDADKEQHGGAFTIEKTTESADRSDQDAVVQIDTVFQETESAPEVFTDTAASDKDAKDGDQGRKRRRRRRGRGRGRGADQDAVTTEAGTATEAEASDSQGREAANANGSGEASAEGEGTGVRKPRRRGRRGGRRSRSGPREKAATASTTEQAEDGEAETATEPASEEKGGEAEPVAATEQAASAEPETVTESASDEKGEEKGDEAKPVKRRPRAASSRGSARKNKAASKSEDKPAPAAESATPAETQQPAPAAVEANGQGAETSAESASTEPASTPKPEKKAPKRKPAKEKETVTADAAVVEEVKETPEPASPPRSGWWQRRV